MESLKSIILIYFPISTEKKHFSSFLDKIREMEIQKVFLNEFLFDKDDF